MERAGLRQKSCLEPDLRLTLSVVYGILSDAKKHPLHKFITNLK